MTDELQPRGDETPPVTPEQLERDTERYVRDCFRILGDHQTEDTIQRVATKIALMMSVELLKRQVEIEAMNACFTPEEQRRANET